MNAQSLSIVVPNKACINNCKFCVARMYESKFIDQLDSNKKFYDLYLEDYRKRIEFARDNGCNTVMLTGDSEPQQNRRFLELFGIINNELEKPFRCIEMQTTGVLLDEDYLRFLRSHVGVTTISLSISSFNDEENRDIIQTKFPLQLKELCKIIKRRDFNLRLSLNMTSAFNNYTADDIFKISKKLGADQITFRIMYSSLMNTEQDKWLGEHTCKAELISRINKYITSNGTFLEKLDFGAERYSVNEMSVVVDNDCMNVSARDVLKYMVLYPNCKLYSKWNDKGSLIF